MPAIEIFTITHRGEQMEVFELTHTMTGRNLGDYISVVGKSGRVWSIYDASRLIIKNEAIFLYGGEVVTDLAMLPAIPNDN